MSKNIAAVLYGKDYTREQVEALATRKCVNESGYVDPIQAVASRLQNARRVTLLTSLVTTAAVGAITASLPAVAITAAVTLAVASVVLKLSQVKGFGETFNNVFSSPIQF